MVGVFYASPAIESLALALPDSAARAVRLAGAIRIDALTPALVWGFFRDFPRALEWPRTRRAISFVLAASVVAAAGLIAANLAIALGAGGSALLAFDRSDPTGSYWTIVFGLLLPAPAFILWRVRHAPEDERRRVRWFAAGLAIGATPVIAFGLVTGVFPGAARWVRQEQTGLRSAQALVLALVVFMAANTAYAVAVQRVLEVGAVLRRAAQHLVARGLTAGVAALPFAGVAVLLYRARAEPISALFAGTRPLAIGAALVAGFALVRARRAAMAAIDRLLFRESYDARRLLADVAARSRATGSVAELADSLMAAIDRALHLESAALLVRDASALRPVKGGARKLELSSPLVGALAQSAGPLVVDLERTGSPLRALPEPERQWLADAAAEVLVPLADSGGGILGVLSLGAKRSELPFSREDLLLLSAIGASAAIGLENQLLRASAAPRDGAAGELEASAAECPRCGWVGAADAAGCPECSGTCSASPLPRELFGKFRLERRVGAGAMGVVYRATDLSLGRVVALKTLPATSPEESVRLRREARAMAAIAHPNLALVFGAESWRGTPVLVLEYLPGGTLADRLSKAPLAPDAALRLAGVLAAVLEHAHASGMLHRDVKPSNIGFTDQGVPKLLDFGLVRIAGESALAAGLRAFDPLAANQSRSALAGTPLYMSPEALSGAPPDPTFDLWSLCVVAFEAMAGRHPFERATPAQTLAAIRDGQPIDLPPPLRERGLGSLFAELFAREQGRRPATARRLAHLFDEAGRALAAAGA